MAEWLTSIGAGPLNGLAVLIAIATAVFIVLKYVLKYTFRLVQWKPRGVLLGCSATAFLLFLIILIIYLKVFHGFTGEVIRFSMASIAALFTLVAMNVDEFWKSSKKFWAIIPLLICSLGLVITFLVIVDWDVWNKVVYPLICGAGSIGIYFLISYFPRKKERI